MTRAPSSIAAVLLGLLSASLPARAEPPAIRFAGGIAKSEPERSTPLLRFRSGRGGQSLKEIRQDALDLRSKTTRKLVDLALRETVLGDPKLRLEVVRALASHEPHAHKSSLKDRLVRALAVHFEGSHDDATGDSSRDGLLRHWIRGTAAMALARSGHPEALRLLLASAQKPDSDLPGAQLATAALRRFVTEEQADVFAPLFTKAEVRAVLTPKLDFELVDHPRKLVALAKHSGDQSDQDEPSLPQMLRALRRQEQLPGDFQSSRAWKDAHQASPTWALRSLAVLSPRLSGKLKRAAVELAQKSSSSKKGSEAHAAIWLLSTLDSPLPKKTPLETQLSFSSTGAHARTFVPLLLSGKLESLDGPLRLMPLHEPLTWDMLSTAQLRALQAQIEEPPLIAALSSRLRTNSTGLGPERATVRAWLVSHESPLVRAAAAHGLARSQDKAALALLLSAYRTESTTRVRRAIVRAVAEQKKTPSATLRQLFELDPDEGCFARAARRADKDESGFYWGQTERKTASTLDREARGLTIRPAPDGFVGLVGPDF